MDLFSVETNDSGGLPRHRQSTPVEGSRDPYHIIALHVKEAKEASWIETLPVLAGDGILYLTAYSRLLHWFISFTGEKRFTGRSR
jgi:hypothetical protein